MTALMCQYRGCKLLRHRLQKIRAEIQPHAATSLPKPPDHIIRHVPHEAAHLPGVGMARHKRLSSMPQHIIKARVRKMRHINDHTQFFHPFYKVDPCFRQPMLRIWLKVPARPHIGIPQLVGIIPGQGEHPHAQPIHFFQLFYFPLAHRALFYSEHGGHLPLALVHSNVPKPQHWG